MALVKCLVYVRIFIFDCAGLHKLPSPEKGCRHFSCKLSRKMALVTCPCAFRQQRLAQNITKCRARDWGMALVKGRVRFDCVGSHKVGVAESGCGIFPVNHRTKWLLWNVPVCAPTCSHMCVLMCALCSHTCMCSHMRAPMCFHMCALMILCPFPNSTQHTVWGLLPGYFLPTAPTVHKMAYSITV